MARDAYIHLSTVPAGPDAPLVFAFHGTGGDDVILAWKQLCSRMLLTYTRLDDYQEVYKEHAELLKAIRSGKKQAIFAAIKANIR